MLPDKPVHFQECIIYGRVWAKMPAKNCIIRCHVRTRFVLLLLIALHTSEQFVCNLLIKRSRYRVPHGKVDISNWL